MNEQNQNNDKQDNDIDLDAIDHSIFFDIFGITSEEQRQYEVSPESASATPKPVKEVEVEHFDPETGETWIERRAVEDKEEVVEEEYKPQIGDKIKVKNHTRHQHLSHGATIEPTIEHQRDGYETTIMQIWQDEYEDEHFNPITVLTIVTADGEQYSLDEIEVI